MERYVIKQVYSNTFTGEPRWWVWMFAIKFFQLCYLFNIFHNKMWEKKGSEAENGDQWYFRI